MSALHIKNIGTVQVHIIESINVQISKLTINKLNIFV